MMQKTSTSAAPVLTISKLNGFENKANANVETQATAPVNAFQSVLKTQQKTQINQAPKVIEQRQQPVAKTRSTHEGGDNKATKNTEAIALNAKTHVKVDAAKQETQQMNSTSTVDEMVALAMKALPEGATVNQEEARLNVEVPENSQPAGIALFGLTPAVVQAATSQDNGNETQTGGSAKLTANVHGAGHLDSKNAALQPELLNGKATKEVDVSTPIGRDAFDTSLNDAKVLQANVQSATLNASMANQEAENPAQLLSTMSGLQKPLAAPAIESPQVAQQAVSSHVAEPFSGKATWNQAISQRVLWMVGAGEQSATLTLNPPDLGPLQVVVQVHNGMADTRFTSDNAEVRQALQDGMENLREKMRESGVQLGQTNVQSGEQSRQEFQQATQQNNLDARKSSNSNTAQNTPVLSQVKSYVANGLVDTFA